MTTVTKIAATIKVSLKPWTAPNFAVRGDRDDSDQGSIPVSDLDDDALEDMALAWVEDLYRKAGRRTSPFYKHAKAHPSGKD